MLEFYTLANIILGEGKLHPEIHCDTEFIDQPFMIAKVDKACQLGDDCSVLQHQGRGSGFYHHKCAEKILGCREAVVCECRDCSPMYSFYYSYADTHGVQCYWCRNGHGKEQ
jgi:hypothetical protein